MERTFLTFLGFLKAGPQHNQCRFVTISEQSEQISSCFRPSMMTNSSTIETKPETRVYALRATSQTQSESSERRGVPSRASLC